MATYVNNLRLKEIATGDESGTWGTSTNTNLELIGEALGYNTQDCFASDADATTTVADGATDPARAFYFKVTSSATLTATRTLTIAPNTVSRVMIIENATTGSQSIAISQGSGANVTVPTGEVKMVYLDGAGAGAAVVDAFTNLKVTDAAQTNITSVGTLTSLTVSGDATFDTSTLKVDSTNNRVGVGTASPDWNLQVESGSNSIVAITSGAASNAQIRFGDSGDDNIGMINYDNSSDSLAFTTNASEAMRIDSSGNVGIGSASPATLLELSANTSSGQNTLRFTDEDSGIVADQNIGKIEFYSNDASGAGGTVRGYMLCAAEDTSPSTYLAFATNPSAEVTGGVERMRIDASGNVGIGQTTLNSALDIDAEQTYNGIGTPVVRIGSVNNTGVYAMYGAGWGGNTTYSPVTFGMIGTSGSGSVKGDFIVATRDATTDSAPSERFRITSDGKTGIGTTSPSHKLEVSDGAVASKYDATDHVAIRGLSSGQYIQYGSGRALSFVAIDTYPNSGASTKMTLDTSGNLLVGTASTTINSSNFGAAIFADGRPKFSKNVSGASHVMNVYGNAGEFRVFGDGDVQNTNNSYGQISDESLKENIVDATNKLNEINQVRIRNFNFIGDDLKQIGVIAQELETIFPSMVKTTPDTDSDGNDLGTETKSVKYSVFVPILIKALQEADDKIDALEARITALES